MTNLLDNIGKARDLIESKDHKKILAKIHLFEIVWKEVKRTVDRHVKNENFTLDFNYYDIADLSNEIADYLNNYPQKFRVNTLIKNLDKHEKIDANIFKEFNTNLCDFMYIDAKLREAQKILSYLALILYVVEKTKEDESLDNVLLETIRSFL